jgi:uncharacterized membrane protein
MLEWIRNNVPPGMIVVEAAFPAGHPFSAYAYSGRVASLAGRPVPLGWPHHEAQWRGASVYETLAQRRDAVAALYGAPDAAAMRAAAAALGARWVLLGRTEREYYGAQAFDQALGVLHEAARLRASFPSARPEVYLFEIGDGR